MNEGEQPKYGSKNLTWEMVSLFKGRRGAQSEGHYVAVATLRCLACNWKCGMGSEEKTSGHVTKDVKKVNNQLWF